MYSTGLASGGLLCVWMRNGPCWHCHWLLGFWWCQESRTVEVSSLQPEGAGPHLTCMPQESCKDCQDYRIFWLYWCYRIVLHGKLRKLLHKLFLLPISLVTAHAFIVALMLWNWNYPFLSVSPVRLLGLSQKLFPAFWSSAVFPGPSIWRKFSTMLWRQS